MTTQVHPAALPRSRKTVLIMDICTIGYIKARERIQQSDQDKRVERLNQIIAMAQSGQYQFSFFLAIIEKSTDAKNPMTCEQMVKEFLGDYNSIVDLIGEDNMREKPEELISLITGLMDDNYTFEDRAELKLKEYLVLLTYFNSLRVYSDPEPPSRRLELAKKVTEYGERLEIGRGHPVISICVASVYGNNDARKILKVDKHGNFNASNALGDILSFYRIAKVEYLITLVRPDLDVVFRTEDQWLEKMRAYYITTVSRVVDDEYYYSVWDLNTKKMFPLLYKKNNLNRKERDALYEMLDFKKPEAHST